MASRIGGTTDEPSDLADIIFLIRHLKLKSANDNTTQTIDLAFRRLAGAF
jgi:hypothetical protein